MAPSLTRYVMGIRHGGLKAVWRLCGDQPEIYVMVSRGAVSLIATRLRLAEL